jgi:hypothetical protein
MTTSHLEARFIQPMKCLAVRRLLEGEGWEYELKLDGCRTSAVKHGGRLTLFPRNRDIPWDTREGGRSPEGFTDRPRRDAWVGRRCFSSGLRFLRCCSSKELRNFSVNASKGFSRVEGLSRRFSRRRVAPSSSCRLSPSCKPTSPIPPLPCCRHSDPIRECV